MMPGGLTPARPATPEIQEIANEVKAQLEEKTNKKCEKYEAVEYKTQVVAGINYFIKMDMGHDCFTHIKVFKGLSENGDLKLTGYQTNKTRDDELTYF
ncbi:cystatin-A-like [Rattus rattus]|uniref:cystatin-A-like n=1 Tax=Rattus rattus TaxID=10117 RepID=UPI0013F2FED4|nr:cystatin-A-like [Rattus rattus]